MIRIFMDKPAWQLWGVIGDPEAASQLADENTVVLSYDNRSFNCGNVIAPRDDQGQFTWSLLEDCDFVIRRSAFGEL